MPGVFGESTRKALSNSRTTTSPNLCLTRYDYRKAAFFRDRNLRKRTLLKWQNALLKVHVGLFHILYECLLEWLFRH